MATRRDFTYIWVTWLTKLLVGENSCEWSAWFRANHEGGSWNKVPSTFDTAEWQLQHTALLNSTREKMEQDGKIVFTESQNSFTLRGRTAALGGKPDLITTFGDRGAIIDIKTGQPSPSHHVQVLLYMYAIPKALGQYKGITFDGMVVYPDHEEYVPSTAVDETFIANFSSLIQRLASEQPARKVPSKMECGFCNITTTDCPDRVEQTNDMPSETMDF
jgi:CRISPR/Cas system-associated exonuclease Cas4 (RecB family)